MGNKYGIRCGREQSMDVFFYVKKEESARVLECGLRLSEWAERKVFLGGVQHACICALLNPLDDLEKFHNEDYVPIKIHVNPKATLVAEGVFYDDMLFEHGVNQRYNDSVMPLEKYVFGTYRKPECLLIGTVGNRYFEVMDKLMDVPVLYDSSEALYVSAQMERGKELYSNFEERLLYRYYCALAEKGLYTKQTTVDSVYAIFESTAGNHIVTVKKVW